MKRFKALPKVNPELYQINPALDKKKYQLTEESQTMRKKVESLLRKTHPC